VATSNGNSEIWNNFSYSLFVWLNYLKFVERRKSEIFIENIRFVTHFAPHVAACWTLLPGAVAPQAPYRHILIGHLCQVKFPNVSPN
jgi:hypothetical protein